MKERQQKANWYVAATHYLTAGFVYPFIMSMIGMFIFPMFITNPIVFSIMVIVLVSVGIWLGVKYSAGFLKKTYIIKERDKVINIAAIYLVILNGVTVFIVADKEHLINSLVWGLISIVIYAVVFIKTSKKYVQND